MSVSVSYWCYIAGARRCLSSSRFGAIHRWFRDGFRLAMCLWRVDTVAGLFTGRRLGSWGWLHGDVIGQGWRGTGRLLCRRFHTIVRRSIAWMTFASCRPVTAAQVPPRRWRAACVTPLLERSLCVYSVGRRNTVWKRTSQFLRVTHRYVLRYSLLTLQISYLLICINIPTIDY